MDDGLKAQVEGISYAAAKATVAEVKEAIQSLVAEIKALRKDIREDTLKELRLHTLECESRKEIEALKAKIREDAAEAAGERTAMKKVAAAISLAISMGFALASLLVGHYLK